MRVCAGQSHSNGLSARRLCEVFLQIIPFIRSRGSACEGERRKHHREDLLPSHSSDPEQVGQQPGGIKISILKGKFHNILKLKKKLQS